LESLTKRILSTIRNLYILILYNKFIITGGGKKMKEKLSYIFIIILMIGAIFQVNSTASISALDVDLEPKSHQPPIYDSIKESMNVILPSKQTDFGFLGVNFTGWTPPDPIIAAGPEHLAVMTNGAIAFFQKDGTMDFQDEIEDSFGFWGNEGATGFVFDPEVIYDPHTDRFMAMACERAPGSKSYYLLAVSDDSNPNGDWYKYRLDVTTEGGGGDIDSPNIAVDSEAVYLTADFFTGGQKYLVYILEKDPLLSGSIGITKSMLITGSQSFGIPVSYGNPPAMYMIEHFEATTNTIVRLHAITDPLGTPDRETYDLTVTAYSPPEDPPQKGTSSRPETFDSRFWSCVWRDGSLWATHHQGTSRVMARWYEIKTNDWPISGTPEVYQSGDIDPGPDIRTFFTSIAPDGNGNAAMCFARSSPDEYISMARCTRSVEDPLGTMGDVVIVKESSDSYSGRWGDYSGVSCDPSDDRTFWMHHEYTPGENIWNTWISSCFVELPNNPPSAPIINGPANGIVGEEYTFTFNSEDPEDDDVYYYIKWGDGHVEIWDGPHSSGVDFEISHSYTLEKTFTIEAKAKDTEGEESDWSTFTITIPRNKVIINPLLLRLLEQFPNSFPFLRYILKL
jgi:hypothetical protein